MDPFTAMAIMGGASALGSIGSSIIGASSAKSSASKSYKYNLQLQKQNQAWQEKMSNTAHQREVADLIAAGLNPVLSAGGSGANTGAVSNGTVTEQPFTPENPMTGFLSAAQTVAGIKNTEANTKLANSNTNLTDTNATLAPLIAKANIAAQYANAGNAKAQTDYTKIMQNIDSTLKQSQTNLNNATTYRTANLSKGEQSREWVKAIMGGVANAAGATLGTTSAVNLMRGMNYSPLPIGFKY